MDIYDVIVVGGGSAGCVLAARLSDDTGRRVLLLEAGPYYREASDLPADLSSSWSMTDSHDWGFRSEPDASGRAIPIPRAKVMGGCSSTNATLALRGAPADYDGWAALGNPGWSFADVLPFFKKLERDLDAANEWHGADGPVSVRRYRREELAAPNRALLEALLAAGYPWVGDANRPGAAGVSTGPVSAVEGTRMSTSVTYLSSARHRQNLTIRARTVVDRLVLERGRAVGVRLAGTDEPLAADLVVLAAGAFCSPAILLRSGIGPADDLRALGIPVAVDLPGVGRNLHDHPGVSCSIPIAPASGPHHQVVATWLSSRPPAGWPYDMHFVPGFGTTDRSPTGALASLFVSVVKPTSRGRLSLRSSDPSDPPRVDTGYLTHPDDLARLVEGLRAARRVVRERPAAAIATGPELLPGPDVPDDEEALAAYARATVGTYHHWVGSCPMGPRPEAGAVVDAKGRVHGVDGLVVADASIMPEVPAANTNLPAIMVAERIAARIANERTTP